MLDKYCDKDKRSPKIICIVGVMDNLMGGRGHLMGGKENRDENRKKERRGTK